MNYTLAAGLICLINGWSHRVLAFDDFHIQLAATRALDSGR